MALFTKNSPEIVANWADCEAVLRVIILISFKAEEELSFSSKGTSKNPLPKGRSSCSFLTEFRSAINSSRVPIALPVLTS